MSSTPAPRSYFAAIPLVATLACLTWAYAPTIAGWAHAWNTNPQYSHGFLVPAFAAYLLWQRRGKADFSSFQPSVWGLAILACGVSLRLAGTYLGYIWAEEASFIPCVAGLAVLFGGWAGWKWSWPSVLFLLFMIPLPHRVAVALSGPLQQLATVSSTFVMQAMALPALAEGTTILLNENTIGVVEACSGLRMLMVFFALSTAAVLVIERHWVDKCIIFVSAIPIALTANILRITVTGALYEMGLAESARHFFHDVAGWLMMPLALAMLWAEVALLNVLFLDTPSEAPRPPAPSRKPRLPQEPAAPRPPRARKKLSEATPEGGLASA
jgi:exosortase